MNKLLCWSICFLISFQISAQQLVPAQLAGKWGFVDNEKVWIIKPKFESVRNFSEGFAAASKKGKWGFINSAGKWSIKPKYEQVGDFSESLAAVKINGVWGYLNPVGDIVVNPAFTKVFPFKNEEAQVVLPGMLPRQRIVINTIGKQISPPYIFRKEVV